MRGVSTSIQPFLIFVPVCHGSCCAHSNCVRPVAPFDYRVWVSVFASSFLADLVAGLSLAFLALPFSVCVFLLEHVFVPKSLFG